MGQWLNIIEVIRYENKDRIVKYKVDDVSEEITITVNDKYIKTVYASEFLENAKKLKEEILKGKSAFEVSDELKKFFKKICMEKASAVSIDKCDIFLSSEHPGTNIVREKIGFSIKSKFGDDPTIFNTGVNSAGIYRLKNMNDALMNKINSIFNEKGDVAVKERCKTLLENGCEFEFVGFPVAARAKCKAFDENLDMLNPRLKEVIDFILREHFLTTSTVRTLEDMIGVVIDKNPCKITRPKEKYPYMMKSFLYASYCGLTAGTPWDGRSNVNGGFIAVNGDGEVLATLAMESEAFKDYLYSRCYFEWPSTSSKHGNYAEVYEENGDYFFRLNFQIRCNLFAR